MRRLLPQQRLCLVTHNAMARMATGEVPGGGVWTLGRARESTLEVSGRSVGGLYTISALLPGEL